MSGQIETRQALNNLVNRKSGISPEMAIRLSKAFGGSPEVWLAMQMAYGLAQAEKNADKINVERYEPAQKWPGGRCDFRILYEARAHERLVPMRRGI